MSHGISPQFNLKKHLDHAAEDDEPQQAESDIATQFGGDDQFAGSHDGGGDDQARTQMAQTSLPIPGGRFAWGHAGE